MCCRDEDSESVLRASLGNVRMWSFKRHKYLFYCFLLLYCMADSAILDEHPHFTHDTASENAAFIKSITLHLDLAPIARPTSEADPRGSSNLMFFAQKLPGILPINISHLLFNSILQNRTVQKKHLEKLTQELLSAQSAFMHSKYHQIPGF